MLKENYKIIDPIKSKKVTTRDLCLGLLSDLGCSVGGMPKDLECEPISSEWEWVRLHKMDEAEQKQLPEHWRELIPQLEDISTNEDAFVNVPDEIIVAYPHLPVMGVCIVDASIKPEDITADDLFWVGDDLDEN